jgi:nitrogen fixation NifU-like protein
MAGLAPLALTASCHPCNHELVRLVGAPTVERSPLAPDQDDIYQEHILDHFESPFHRGHCPQATHAYEDDNPLCGDFVHIDLAIDDQGRIREAWFDGDGCCISLASASMLMQRINGSTVAEAQNLTAEDMLALLGVRLTPNRQKCCLLPWRVMKMALFSPVTSSAAAPPPTNGSEHAGPAEHA